MSRPNSAPPNQREPAKSSSGGPDFGDFVVLTLNVYFGEKERARRSRALVELIRQIRPHVVALQELVHEVAGFLVAQLRALYDAQIGDWVEDSYGVALFVRRDVIFRHFFKEYELDSEMDRSLLVAEFYLPRTNPLQCVLAVGTVHLESLTTQPTRRRQLVECETVLREYPSSLLVGDFNFDATENHWRADPDDDLHNLCLQECLPNHVDLWGVLKPGEPGYTFDTSRNFWAKRFRPRRDRVERARYDRCMASLDSNIWKVRSIELCADRSIGEVQVGGDEAQLFMSDHFGLVCALDVA